MRPPPCVAEGPFWDDNAGNEWVVRAVAPDGSTPLRDDGLPLAAWAHTPEGAMRKYLAEMAQTYGQTAEMYGAQGLNHALWVGAQDVKQCLCCANALVLTEGDDICYRCGWEDDAAHGYSMANGMTLAEGRANVKAHGRCTPATDNPLL